MVELAYRDEIGPKRKAVRILGQIADKANLLGDIAEKKSVEDEKTKLNEAIKSFATMHLHSSQHYLRLRRRKAKGKLPLFSSPQTQNAR